MSDAISRERITIKDIELILGLKKTKAQQIFSALRKSKQRQLAIEQRLTKKPLVFVDDLVQEFPGLTREACKSNMSQ